ncbi:unnamed protein product [Merluccius merluccius]
MGVEGCTKCIKYLLFFFNFIFWFAGGVILGVALWLRHDPKTSHLLDGNFEDVQAPTTFYTSVYILIAVGAVMMVVGFLGCYGAIQESQCLLGTFFACLVILFACEVAAGIWGYMHKDTVAKEVSIFYDSMYDRAMSESLSNEKRVAATSALRVFHETLDCCGKGQMNSIFTVLAEKLGIVDMCPKSSTLTVQNCHTRITDLFTDKIYLIGIAALVVAVIIIFEMIFSMVLCCGIRNSPVY